MLAMMAALAGWLAASPVPNDCHNRRSYKLSSGATVDACARHDHGGFDSGLTLTFGDGTKSRIHGRYTWAKEEGGRLVPLKINHYQTSEPAPEDVAKLSGFTIVEMADVLELTLPLRLHRFDCASGTCRKTDERCAIERPFRVEAARLAERRHGLHFHRFEDPAKDLGAGKEYACPAGGNPFGVFFDAFAGDLRARRCAAAMKRDRAPGAVFEQLDWAAAHCPGAESPAALSGVPVETEPASKASPVLAELMVWGGEAGPTDVASVRPMLAKNGGKWEPSSDDLAFGPPARLRFEVPASPRVSEENTLAAIGGGWELAQPRAADLAFSAYYDGRVLGRVTITELGAPMAASDGITRMKTAVSPEDWERLRAASIKNPRSIVLARPAREFGDPDQWKRAPVPEALAGVLRKTYAADYSEKPGCPAGELELNARSFRSESGAVLAGVHKLKPCWADDGLPDSELERWYYVPPGGAPRLAEKAAWWPGQKLWVNGPYEAGDFDADGRSEWIFRHEDDHGRVAWSVFEP